MSASPEPPDALPRGADAIRKLAPYALGCAVLYATIAVVIAVAGYSDLVRSMEEQPTRFIYSVVMLAGLSTSFAIAAYIAFNAWSCLRQVGIGVADVAFQSAIQALELFLRAFFFWLAVMLLALLYAIFQ